MRDVLELIADLNTKTWVSRIFESSIEIIDPESEQQYADRVPGIPTRKRITVYEVSPDGMVGQRRSIAYYEDPVSKEVAYQDKLPSPILESNRPSPVVEQPKEEAGV